VAAKLIRATESDIAISGSVRNGRLEATVGNILVQKGLVSNEIISAPLGTVEIIGNVESGSVIYAKKVIVQGQISHSLVIADEIEIKSLLSSQVLGKNIRIETANAKRGIENIVFVEVPNQEAQEGKSKSLAKEIKEIRDQIALFQTETGNYQKQTPIPIEKIVTFLNGIAAIKAKSETMGESDRKQFRAILPYMEIVKKYVNAIKEIVQKEAEIFKKEEELKELDEAILREKAGVGAEVKYVTGSTRVHRIRFENSRDETLDYPKFLGHTRDIGFLNSEIGSCQLLFEGASGNVDWKLLP
jgi:hypothetical protein